MDDIFYMQEAISLAKIAADMGEVPVGAVIVKNCDGIIIGTGYNRRETDNNALAHAEILAIQQANQTLNSWRLSGCTLYVTLEPCAMCAGAVINSRLERVVFGAYDYKAGSVGSIIDLFSLGYNHKPVYEGGILERSCGKLLSDFFRELRGK